MKLASGIVSVTLLAAIAYLIYIATNVPMDYHEAGLLVCLFVVIGAMCAGAIGGFIASFFEEAN